VVGAFQGLIAPAGHLAPFDSVFDELHGVDMVVGEDLAVFLMGRVDAAEHNGHTVHAGHRVT